MSSTYLGKEDGDPHSDRSADRRLSGLRSELRLHNNYQQNTMGSNCEDQVCGTTNNNVTQNLLPLNNKSTSRDYQTLSFQYCSAENRYVDRIKCEEQVCSTSCNNNVPQLLRTSQQNPQYGVYILR